MKTTKKNKFLNLKRRYNSAKTVGNPIINSIPVSIILMDKTRAPKRGVRVW